MGVSDPAVYALVSQVLQAVLRPPHATGFAAVSALVWAVLVAQSLHPADLVRALPDLATAHARQGFRRVHRGLTRARPDQSGADAPPGGRRAAPGHRRRGAAGAR